MKKHPNSNSANSPFEVKPSAGKMKMSKSGSMQATIIQV